MDKGQGVSHECGQLLLLIEQPLHLAPQLPLNLSLTMVHSVGDKNSLCNKKR